MDDYRLLSLRQAADLLGVTWLTARDLVETGQLRAVKIGTRYRVPASALREIGGSLAPGVSSGVSSRTTNDTPTSGNGARLRPLRQIKTVGFGDRG